MTYSVESLVFRVAAGVVNTAARAANSLLEVLYPPRYDVAHIWDELDVPACSVASGGPAPTGPTPGVAADPAEGATPPAPSAGSLTWAGWAEPAICEVLNDHFPVYDGEYYRCVDTCGGTHHKFLYPADWIEHVADEIARRIACDPTKAALALTSLQSQ